MCMGGKYFYENKTNITLNDFNTIKIMNNKYNQNIYNENVNFVIFL